MFSHEYYFKDGRHLFVSNQTLNQGVRNQLATKEGVLKGCEVVLSFKRFNGAKTGIGVGMWLYDEHLEKGLKPSYVVYHATDGASNAVASANHNRLLAEMNGVYESRILHNTCLAHQNNRSAKFASGTGDFKMAVAQYYKTYSTKSTKSLLECIGLTIGLRRFVKYKRLPIAHQLSCPFLVL
jgi:hypothetical protein